MYKDPHIRSYYDSPPLIPGTLTRFRWPRRWDSEVRMIRERVQGDGRGLFMLRAPYPGEKLLVEAYYPEHMREGYVRQHLDPLRRYEVGMGNLVVVKVLDGIKPPGEPLDMRHIREIRRNNRNARRDLKRQASAKYRKSEMERRREEEEQEVYDHFNEFVRQAKVDTYKYAIRPHVGPADSI